MNYNNLKTVFKSDTMKRIVLIITTVLVSCNSSKTNENTVDNTKKSDPDIILTSSELTNGVMSDNYFITNRIGKKIQVTNVELSDIDKVGNTEVYISGTDGDIHMTEDELCCRFIFRLQDTKSEFNDIHHKIGSVTGILKDIRDNPTYVPMVGKNMSVKELVFDSCIVNLNPTEKRIENKPEQQKNNDPQNENNLKTSGLVSVDKTYFYDRPDLNTRRKGYLVKGQNVTITSEVDGFYYCIYTNEKDVSTSGWILKTDVE